MLRNVIIDVTVSSHSFVFGKSRAGFTNVSGLAVAAIDLVYCSFLSSSLSLPLTLVISRHKVVAGLCATRIL